ncbi:LEA type 2 family protein [Olivibacter sp. XZL3]|uniref:LEA type 2 family protein n=1 Tax=Olivibacter sp. XZL3 TaxID=1735116 RepID=UPI0010661EEC|nr:LEA type 2 family protein [Olivibacter sp. XZL3]
MNRLLLMMLLLVFMACGVNQQAKQIKALEQCKYEVKSVDSVFLAGTDVVQLLRSGNIDTRSMGGVAMGMLRKEIPLKGILKLKITNPTTNLAGINQFQYQLLMKDRTLATGLVNQQIKVKPGETAEIPVLIDANVYGLLSNGSVLQELSDFISGKNPNQESVLTIKLKPTIAIGNKTINYPGWITFDRKVTRNLLL